eukprot:6171880-Pleurochrysis_carterae.AAC.1
MGMPYSVSIPSSVLSDLNLSERTHHGQLFDPLIHDPYWVEGVIGPYDYDSFLNASLYTHSHRTIIADACGLDNHHIYLLLFGDQPRTSTYTTGGRRDGINSLIHIGVSWQRLAPATDPSRPSTPAMVHPIAELM